MSPGTRGISLPRDTRDAPRGTGNVECPQGSPSRERCVSPGTLRPQGRCARDSQRDGRHQGRSRRAGNVVCPQGRCVSGTLLQGRTGRVCCVSPGTCAPPGNVVCPQGRCVSPGTKFQGRGRNFSSIKYSRQQNRPSTKRSCELFVLRPIGACSGENSRNTTRHRAVNDWPSTIPV